MTEVDAMLSLIESRMIATDDALGKELLSLVEKSGEREALVAMASQHLTQAIFLLELAGGPALPAAILGHRLDGLRRSAN